MTARRTLPIVASAIVGLVLAGFLSGASSCYAPNVEDCQYSCAARACPDEMFCNQEQKCVGNPDTTCGVIFVDGGSGSDSMPPEDSGGFLDGTAQDSGTPTGDAFFPVD
ncbi:MAG TPA: hypothetical protein VFQ53_24635 [Kofleriaceae bacterium]|nr:hypothetical protein [Kofleriaceae bacterium]